jgi:hypothetical protein
MKLLYLVFLLQFLAVMVLCVLLAAVTGHLIYLIPAVASAALAVHVTFAEP